ncbi:MULTISPECIES: transcriptional regulator GcvA [Pseudoalteromonas]|uniref:Transcriptional regulator n=1 Tax=Pseudoalteromonas ruthenica TaxID=151081 RepID=A0A0F4PN49_9GAMM|nr:MULTISPECIES: transcriptional regulator GcvA [Pseudoalteromonas]KJY96443.1 transcriptional regulator [Pseudoalteromonas ruthenica]KJY98002.1 transcriptional regulator [Pseudoalteromonas ruthenica]MCF2863608.1 transcriptional regulator GcvA [Pseudoalteromonas sp. CNAT2-18]MCG7546088.1 transcriptional regulator GcvA [Pseudoalteromonas sp. MM17-2]MCG7558561.1 transcriptional regulator GcvA [Pseudoalteromonas sp. CNAT2-18.1]|tara:strand:+ start:1570 stop:2469 length:900 start_codon:yes stop_codon:yes gene_type:complete
MARRLPPLNSLKAFEAAARHLSFTKAAEELYVTQAAVSHQIKTLEEHLGLKLFLRKNRSLLLTEEGQGYFLDIKEIFAQLVDATEKLLARGAKGSLTVSLTPSFAIQWLVPRLSLFNELHPEIDVRIKAQDQDDNSLQDDVDIAIYYGRGHWSGVETHKLHTEYLVPLCSPMLLNGPKPLNEPQDLQYHTLLHDTTRRPWKLWMKTAGVRNVQVNQGPIFSHSSMAMQAAAHGQGVALGNLVLAKPEIDAGRLIVPFNHTLESKNAYYLVFRESQSELGKIVSFKEWMLGLVEKEQEQL